MTFQPYTGTPAEWETEREVLASQHVQAPGLEHDNMLAGFCTCRFAKVTAGPTERIEFDGRTCASCGGSSFRVTGTCHTCNTCGTSDGCG